jgi:predicted transcriptional regulator
LYNLGYTTTEVAEKMNCDIATVTRILKSKGVYQHKDRLGRRIN